MNPHDAQTPLAAPDAESLIRSLDLEIAMRRAKRLSHDAGQGRTSRLLGITLLFVLLFAALGALWYIQTARTERGFIHRRPAGSPTPAASTPAVR